MSDQTLIQNDSDIEDENEGSIDSFVNISISDYKVSGTFRISQILLILSNTFYLFETIRKIYNKSTNLLK